MDIESFASSSRGNLYQLTYYHRKYQRKSRLLIEAGLPIKKIKEALNYNLSDVEGCLISHSHNDHAKAVPDLLKAGMNVYMAVQTTNELDLPDHHRLFVFWDQDELKEIGPFKVRAFPLVHDVYNSGYLIVAWQYKVLFAIDTNYIKQRFRGLTHIMLGVDYDKDILMDNVTCGYTDYAVGKRVFKNHMSYKTAKAFLQTTDLSKVREIHLLHLSDLNSDAEKWKREVEGMTGRPVYI